jgi:hypothetical protein
MAASSIIESEFQRERERECKHESQIALRTAAIGISLRVKAHVKDSFFCFENLKLDNLLHTRPIALLDLAN